LVTPGSNRIDFKTSTSPKTHWHFFMVEIESLLTLISGFLISVLFYYLDTTLSFITE
jgi:hypothetical protein